ncbi:MAG: hypothetical protein COT73_03190 [Bdellovibrio sp. CG10_big_fil_rev_8_21_14_0_10_47_8]|nr:MAG: hypothetical protein COT73_03190 [Bdellovibrio sp. CG10_big_fil_rev_8_21_14_0_10_47_8]
MKTFLKMTSLALMGLLVLSACRAYVGGGYGYGRGGWYAGSGHHGYYDGYGRWRRGHWDNQLMTTSSDFQTDAASEDPARLLSEDFSISRDSAGKILEVVKTGNKEALKAINVKPRELAPLLKLQMPDRGSIEKIADALNEDPAKIENIMSHFIMDIRAQRANAVETD